MLSKVTAKNAGYVFLRHTVETSLYRTVQNAFRCIEPFKLWSWVLRMVR